MAIGRVEQVVREWLTKPNAEMRLLCGEMTTGEILAVRAVLWMILRTSKQEDGQMTCSKCGKKVRGRPAKLGVCKACRAADEAAKKQAEQAAVNPVAEAVE